MTLSLSLPSLEDTLAFGVANATKLRPGDPFGTLYRDEVPVWDIADNFDDTNLLVSNMEQGRDLAKCLGGNNVALMRGHGLRQQAAPSSTSCGFRSICHGTHAR